MHIPAPHDQLYERLFLIPDGEFRKRSTQVRYHGIPCHRFTAQFAGEVDKDWAPFVVEIDQLSAWVAAIPGWVNLVPVPPLTSGGQTLASAENYDIAAIGSLWAASELERIALGRIMIVEDRVRLDPVTFLVHDLQSQRFGGLHLRTSIFNKTRRIHFDVKRHHFFSDPDLWVLLVLLRPDRSVHDYVLLIPSADIPELGFSETMTLDPLTKRFRKYQVPAEDFGRVFMEKAFAVKQARGRSSARFVLRKAS